MPRNAIYWCEWNNDAGHRLRVEIIPADNSMLSSPTMIQLPPDCTIDIGELTAKYDKYPLGLPDTGSLTVKFDLRSLEGSDALRDLRGYLKNPEQENSGTLVLNGSGTNTRLFNTATVITVFTNYGTGDPTHVWFQGVVKKRFTRTHKLSEIASQNVSAELEMTVPHIARICLETVIPSDLSARVFDQHESDSWTPTEANVYEMIIRVGSVVYSWYSAELGVPYMKIKLYKFIALWQQLQQLSQQVYRQLLRQASATLNFSQSWSGIGINPYGIIGTYKQNYHVNGGKGTALSYSDWYILGAKYPSHLSDEPENYVGGMLVDTGSDSDSIFRFGNCWDLLKNVCASVPMKVWIVLTSGSTAGKDLTVQFARPLSGVNTQIQINDVEQEDMEFEEPYTLRGGRVAIPGMGNDDRREVFYSPLGIEAEQEQPIRGMWNTIPRIGNRRDVEFRYRITQTGQYYGSSATHPDMSSGDYVAVRSLRHNYWAFYYRDTPTDGVGALTNKEIAIRVHASVAIYDGRSGSPFESAWSIVWPTLSGSADVRLQMQQWWDDIVAVSLLIQKTQGISFAVSDWWQSVWGRSNNVLFKSTSVPINAALNGNTLGFTYKIGSGTANTFLNGETFYGDISTERLNLLSIQANSEDGAAKCDFIYLDVE